MFQRERWPHIGIPHIRRLSAPLTFSLARQEGMPMQRSVVYIILDEGADQTLGGGDRSTSFHHRSEHHSTVPLHQPGLRSSDTGNRVSR